MIKNILIYLTLLISVFIFNIFYYGWFSWFLLLIVLGIPMLSLVFSLPFMILGAVKGITVFANNKINIGDDFYFGISGKNGSILFLPQIKVNIKVKNSFAKLNKKIMLVYGGSLYKPYYKKCNNLSKHCGIIEADAKYCKIYDMLGIFFIPIKIDCHLQCSVMPKAKKPEKLFEKDVISVIGYKPKVGGGYSESYDLRAYQSGDSLKNIHWKLSSKLDDIIVREPTEPIRRQLLIKTEFTENSDENDDILARFIYVCRYIIKNNSECFCIAPNRNEASLVKNSYELERYIKSVFSGESYNKCTTDSNSIVYSIFAHCEEVSGI